MCVCVFILFVCCRCCRCCQEWCCWWLTLFLLLMPASISPTKCAAVSKIWRHIRRKISDVQSKTWGCITQMCVFIFTSIYIMFSYFMGASRVYVYMLYCGNWFSYHCWFYTCICFCYHDVVVVVINSYCELQLLSLINAVNDGRVWISVEINCIIIYLSLSSCLLLLLLLLLT